MFTYTLLFLALVGLLGGLIWLIQLRFARGDTYAVRSSLRTDPLGSKALYEAYSGLEGFSVQRNLTPLDQIAELPADATLLMLNVSGWEMYQYEDAAWLFEFVERGGRLVVAMEANSVAYEHLEDETLEVESDSVEVESDSSNGVNGSFTRRLDDEDGFWAEMALQHGVHEGGPAILGSYEATLPTSVPWREGGVLVEYDASLWQPVYWIGDEVVAATRAYGAGAVVLMTDDYLFSNEALLQHRFPTFLAWVAGDKSLVIFEETHLGVSERTGIATLIHRYHLAGFFIAFAGCMILVIWRGASPLLPPFSMRAKGNLVQLEHSSEAGLSDLIRRSKPYDTLPQAAFDQWKSCFIRNQADERYFAEVIKEAQLVLSEAQTQPRRKRNPAQTHLAIKTIINRKKRRRT